MAPKQLFASMVAFLFLTLGAHSISGQSQCTLKLTDLPQPPELLGFRLGMTMDQVKARVPQVGFGKTDDLGVSKITINPDFDARFDKSTFVGVRSLSLDFLDAKLVSLWFGFDSSFKWKTVAEFVNGISRSLQLPNTWQTWRVRGQQLHCADFSLTVSIIAEGPSFRVEDDSAEEVLAERREAKEAAAENPAAEDESADDVAEVVVGDQKTKTYFTAQCKPGQPVARKDRVLFQNTAAAEKAGFTRSKTCAN